MAEFQNHTCGCLGNIKLCLATYFCPCVIAGKIAESVGQNCLVYGCLAITPCGIFTRAKTREAIREKYGIGGSLPMDCACHWCCGLCSIVQEGQEIMAKNDAPEEFNMLRM